MEVRSVVRSRSSRPLESAPDNESSLEEEEEDAEFLRIADGRLGDWRLGMRREEDLATCSAERSDNSLAESIIL